MPTDVDVKETTEKPDVNALYKSVMEGEEKTGVVEPPSPGDSSGDTDLAAQVAALKQELTRVRNKKGDTEGEVATLREELARLTGQLDVLTKQSTTTSDKTATYTDEQLLEWQTEWEDVLADGRAAIRAANGDPDMVEKGNQAVSKAKAQLSLIRQTLHKRAKDATSQQMDAQVEQQAMNDEIVDLYEDAFRLFPDLKDKNSDLWKAGNEQFLKYPRLMKQLGKLGEVVALSKALASNPDLMGEGQQKARKALLDNLEKAFNTPTPSVKGSGSADVKTKPDYKSMPRNQFEEMVNKVKAG